MRDEAKTLSDAEIEDKLTRYIRRELRCGYRTDKDILEGATDYLTGRAPAERSRPIADRVLKQELKAFEQEMRSWPESTDCDRLDAAFAALEKKGIIARAHFTCCGSCGQHEIGDEVAKASSQKRAVRGYTFFHAQDTEAAAEGDGLMLYYGPNPHDENRITAIGQEVEETIKQHGLRTEWNGSADQRIVVKMDWKRRR